MGLRHLGEQLGTEGFVPKPVDKEVSKAVLLRRARLDVSSVYVADLEQCFQSLDDKFDPCSMRVNAGAG